MYLHLLIVRFTIKLYSLNILKMVDADTPLSYDVQRYFVSLQRANIKTICIFCANSYLSNKIYMCGLVTT